MPRGSTLEIPTKEGISLGESDFPLQCPQKDLSRLDFSLSLSFVVRPPDQPTPPLCAASKLACSVQQHLGVGLPNVRLLKPLPPKKVQKESPTL